MTLDLGRIIAALLGLVFAVIGIAGVVTGKVRVRSMVSPYFDRRKEPWAFWMTVTAYVALGVFVMVGAVWSRIHV
jgi:hypothetical protein